ncbi:MAG TPA: glutamate formimidoyltransferase [Puia sp.]|nr:glutamate formimidoyltransferase [Puia sp.]
MQQLIECVPNFSEGNDLGIIKQITGEIESVDSVKLLNVDPGKATNRTVVTFVGPPEAVLSAAFKAIKKAGELIDMRNHRGEHPRMGATDVCPLIPIANISMEDTAAYAIRLARQVGEQLGIPAYLYEEAQTRKERRNLSVIRAGEYESFFDKIKLPEWVPDFGPAEFDAKRGATVIGARDFLVAYNVNLNTTSVRRANAIAFDVREAGRTIKSGGKIITIPGSLKHVKGIGWYIEEYGFAQVSMNLTNIRETPLHVTFDEVCKKAEARGIRVTGSELVGLIPLDAMLEAGRYFLKKQMRSAGVSENELIDVAVKTLGLNELAPFEPKSRIIEYLLENEAEKKLSRMSLEDFADETASESPAPGGGSISAYIGSLGASLAAMVANLSSHKRGWDSRWEEFSGWAEKGQYFKQQLLNLVDKDTHAFNAIMKANSLPKSTPIEQETRSKAISLAVKGAIEVPISVMKYSLASMKVIKAMTELGSPSSVSDAGVAALCAKAAVQGAFLNVRINASALEDLDYKSKVIAEGGKMELDAIDIASEIDRIVMAKIDKSD